MTLPLSFVERMQCLMGKEVDLFLQSLGQDSPVSIRMNRKKTDFTPVYQSVPWCESGYYLPERIHFTFDPVFHAGAYYVQEASSMFLEQIIKQYVTDPVRCLDLCAAPGGKSTHLLSLLPEGSLLVSNEVIKSRSHILAENINKWGNPSVIVTNNDPEQIGKLTGLFDVIITDVPCSGEGMFRKDTDSVGEWSEANVELCASRQRRILHDIWNALAPGGLLVYSTCTYNTKENEENIAWLIEQFGAEPLRVISPQEWNITGALQSLVPVCRFFPHKIKGEGFFIAALQKTNEKVVGKTLKSGKKRQDKKQQSIPENVRQQIKDSDRFLFEQILPGYRAFPIVWQESYQIIKEQLRIVSAGIHVGEVKGKDFIPGQSLALSTEMNVGEYAEWELSWEEAIKYLRREPLPAPGDKPKGYLLMVYKGIRLGFVKNLGNRVNNLYPNEWRIRSGYLPEDLKILF